MRPARARLFTLVELQRSRVDAVAQMRRTRPVFEHMAEMGIAPAAHHFGTTHAVGVVIFRLNVFPDRRGPETWPASPRIEFGVRAEQLISTANTAVRALFVVVPVLTGKCPLRTLLACHIELLIRQLLLPLFVAFFDLFHDTLPISGFAC